MRSQVAGGPSYTQAGRGSAPVLVYYRGAPGAAQEGTLLEAASAGQGLRELSIQRFAAPPELKGERYFQWLAMQFRQAIQDELLMMVGFSIGGLRAAMGSRTVFRLARARRGCSD